MKKKFRAVIFIVVVIIIIVLVSIGIETLIYNYTHYTK